MTDSASLAVFDDAVIRAVAAENDVDERRLREALTAHQRTMADNPGVENLVYEWRKRFEDPLLARTTETFVLSVPPTVWEEFREHMDVDERIFAAVTAVHQEQTLRADAVDLSAMAPDNAAIVVSR